MVITRVRKALRSRKEATFTQIAAETSLDPATLRTALDYWIDRGDVEEVPPGSGSNEGEEQTATPQEIKCAACPLVGACTIPQPKRPRSCDVPPEGTLFVWRGGLAGR